jgi:hypothetical protein
MFYLDVNPKVCATYHYDVHVRKMILESAQLLSTCHRFLDGREVIKLDKANRRRKTYVLNNELEDILYKSTHVNHPVSIWLRKSTGNYDYLYQLYLALCEEYKFRFGKSHKSENLKEHLQNYPMNLVKSKFTEPTITTDETAQCKTALLSYQKYYATSKLHLLEYTKREIPYFIKGWSD